MSNTFVTIAKFQYSSEAQIIKGRLESEGVKVFLSDNFTIETDPLVSQAIGGVKLKVLSEDVIKAKHILDSIRPYSIDDKGNPMQCPHCKSKKVQLFSSINSLKSFLAFIVGFLFNSLPFHTKHRYRCEACQTEFDHK